MANLFDSTNYPTSEPKTLIVGDRWVWSRTLSDYPTSDYALSYHCRREGDGLNSSAIAINATVSGGDFIIEVGQATTQTYQPGRYHWQAYITRNSDGERITYTNGLFVLKNNLANDISDPQSHARICLANINAVLENRATKDQESYSIGGRALSRTPLPELMKFKKYYLAEIEKERRRHGKSGKILTRFVGR